MDQVEVSETVADVGVVSDSKPEQTGIEFKKKDLIQAIVDNTDHKRSDIKEITEAVLKVLAERVASGDTLNLQPFGKVTLLNKKEMPNARILKTKIRQSLVVKEKNDESEDAVADPVDHV